MNDVKNYTRAHDIAQVLRFKDSQADWDAVHAAALRALNDADRRHAERIYVAEAERDEARARLASAQHDVEVYRDAVIEARELARVRLPHHDLLRVDLLRIFEDLHGLPALDADQGAGDGT